MTKVETRILNSNGLVVHCPNSDCDYTWRYTGRFNFYATCPSCRRNIKIAQNKVESLRSGKLGGESQSAAITSAEARGLSNG